MKITSPIEKRTRAYAKRYGYLVRRVPHSAKYPNGYVKIIAPDGREKMARDMVEAHDVIREMRRS